MEWVSYKICEKSALGWSRDPAPVNMIPFTSRTGAVSRIPEDGTAKDFFNLFVSEAFVEETNRYARQCTAHEPDRSGEKLMWKK